MRTFPIYYRFRTCVAYLRFGLATMYQTSDIGDRFEDIILSATSYDTVTAIGWYWKNTVRHLTTHRTQIFTSANRLGNFDSNCCIHRREFLVFFQRAFLFEGRNFWTRAFERGKNQELDFRTFGLGIPDLKIFRGYSSFA